MLDYRWSIDPERAVAFAASALRPELSKQVQDVPERIRMLFNWYGSGSGPWTGFPVYEEVPGRLLLDYEPSDLVSALERAHPSKSEIEGAARFFSGRTLNAKATLPAQLKQVLWEHVLVSGDQNKVERARQVLGKD